MGEFSARSYDYVRPPDQARDGNGEKPAKKPGAEQRRRITKTSSYYGELAIYTFYYRTYLADLLDNARVKRNSMTRI